MQVRFAGLVRARDRLVEFSERRIASASSDHPTIERRKSDTLLRGARTRTLTGLFNSLDDACAQFSREQAWTSCAFSGATFGHSSTPSIPQPTIATNHTHPAASQSVATLGGRSRLRISSNAHIGSTIESGSYGARMMTVGMGHRVVRCLPMTTLDATWLKPGPRFQAVHRQSFRTRGQHTGE